jgi:molybdenum cofactor biosynthesis protein MoaC
MSEYKMINIIDKKESHRIAKACGSFYAKSATIELIKNKKIPKGDPLTICEIAGILAAKNTSQILPLCHPISLSSVKIETKLFDEQILVISEVHCFSKTGVEMEALTAVNAALLCIYDLVKIVDPELLIGDVFLIEKIGGKSGHWINPKALKDERIKNFITKNESSLTNLQDLNFAVITISDSVSQKKSDDTSGQTIIQTIQKNNGLILETKQSSDDFDELKLKFLELLENNKIHVIISTGGTGASFRDQTPEVLEYLIQNQGGKILSGIGELLRLKGLEKTPYAVFSRSNAYIINNKLVITLPGSQKAVQDGLEIVLPLIPHLIHTMKGGKH